MEIHLKVRTWWPNSRLQLRQLLQVCLTHLIRLQRTKYAYETILTLSTESSDEKIALLGAIQSLFEGSMYTFVFLWTPALSPNEEDIPHGFIFATFMLSSMLGSSIASRLLARKLKVEGYMQIVFSISAVTLVLPVVTNVRTCQSLFLGYSLPLKRC